jgi:hypothetical protein
MSSIFSPLPFFFLQSIGSFIKVLRHPTTAVSIEKTFFSKRAAESFVS